ERAADGAVADVAGPADGDGGRALGDAVALADDSMGGHFLPAGKERLGTFFGTDHDEAERVELAGPRGVENVTEKRGRGEQQRGFARLDAAHETGGVGGIGMMDDAHAADKRQDDVATHAEAVERREE